MYGQKKRANPYGKKLDILNGQVISNLAGSHKKMIDLLSSNLLPTAVLGLVSCSIDARLHLHGIFDHSRIHSISFPILDPLHQQNPSRMPKSQGSGNNFDKLGNTLRVTDHQLRNNNPSLRSRPVGTLPPFRSTRPNQMPIVDDVGPIVKPLVLLRNIPREAARRL